MKVPMFNTSNSTHANGLTESRKATNCHFGITLFKHRHVHLETRIETVVLGTFAGSRHTIHTPCSKFNAGVDQDETLRTIRTATRKLDADFVEATQERRKTIGVGKGLGVGEGLGLGV
jgi:hypothetical protein